MSCPRIQHSDSSRVWTRTTCFRVQWADRLASTCTPLTDALKEMYLNLTLFSQRRSHKKFAKWWRNRRRLWTWIPSDCAFKHISLMRVAVLQKPYLLASQMQCMIQVSWVETTFYSLSDFNLRTVFERKIIYSLEENFY